MAQASQRTAAILFSGGDAPGMNALLRAFVRLGLNRHKARVLGVKDGFAGLIRSVNRRDSLQTSDVDFKKMTEERVGLIGINDLDQDLVWMDHSSVSRIVDRGGIRLGASRCPEFRVFEHREQVNKLLFELEVESLVVVGGDGSMAGAEQFTHETGLRVIGIPATIDNDFPLTDESLGWDTAVNNVVSFIRLVNDTAGSHHRIMVMETMGRASGHLALEAALASGAEIVITPDRGTVTQEKMRKIAERIEEAMNLGRTHAIVVVAEGVSFEGQTDGGPARFLTEFFQKRFNRVNLRGEVTHIDTRDTVLGHLQRGGAPSARDAKLAADFAEAAWKAIVPRRGRKFKSGVLGLVGRNVMLHPFGVQPKPSIDPGIWRKSETERVYQLQKDLSDHHPETSPAKTSESKSKPTRKPSNRK